MKTYDIWSEEQNPEDLSAFYDKVDANTNKFFTWIQAWLDHYEASPSQRQIIFTRILNKMLATGKMKMSVPGIGGVNKVHTGPKKDPAPNKDAEWDDRFAWAKRRFELMMRQGQDIHTAKEKLKKELVQNNPEWAQNPRTRPMFNATIDHVVDEFINGRR